MRFNSYEFIFVFLPLVWLGWRLALQLGGLRSGIVWLALSSLGFYAYWDWRFAPLLVGSLMVNYLIGRKLAQQSSRGKFPLLLAGLVWNLGLLGYFKYWNFFLTNLNSLTGAGLHLEKIVLPLGISFFTFQKIAFLVDAYKGKVKEVGFLDFALFVMFFPQLIAGPIVHHGEFIPQIRENELTRFDARRFVLGCTVFAAGLFQKCVVADTLAPVADNVFGIAAQGTHLRVVEAWVGMLSYTFQLFYDFAGYSHMAIGLALLFGFRLPVNFLAPYTSKSMIEFWRRWHMTLSAFLRDYVYIPLGGNRNRHLTNLFLTMFIAGLWHGAGWTFILWGVWHGLALVINHGWVQWRTGGDKERLAAYNAAPSSWFAQPLTLILVGFGWVLFRAPDLRTAWLMFQSLVGWHGISVPAAWESFTLCLSPIVRARGFFPNISFPATAMLVFVVGGYLACRGPKILRWLGLTEDDVTTPAPWLARELAPRESPLRLRAALVGGLCFALAVAALTRSSVFLYFQF